MPARIPIAINGVIYPSKVDAYKSLGIPKPKFDALLRTGNISKAVHDYLHPYGVFYQKIHPRLNIALAVISRREKMYARVTSVFSQDHRILLTTQNEYVVNGDSVIEWTCTRCKTQHSTKAELLVMRSSGCGVCSKSVKDPSGLQSVVHLINQKSGTLIEQKAYINRFQKHSIRCQNGHTFSLSANELLNKQRWCPRCYGRPGENTARHILEQLLNCRLEGPIRNIPWMIQRTGQNLELDGYNDSALINDNLHKIGFEYQGSQHYLPHWRGGQKELTQLQKRDAAKANACEQEGVLLIVVKHFKEDSTFDEKVAHIKNILLASNISFKTSPISANPILTGKSKLEDFKAVLIERGIVLLTDEYRGVHGKYDVYCPLHNYYWVARYSDMHPKYRHPTGCPRCGRERTIAATKARRLG